MPDGAEVIIAAPQGVKFFSEIFEEMFSDLSPDSFRVPTLNSKLLISEYIYVLHNKSIDRAHLPVISAEISAALDNDIVLWKIIGKEECKKLSRILTSKSDDTDTQGLIISISRKISQSYFETAKTLLWDSIADGNFSHIYKLCKIIGAELKESYSREFILRNVRYHFNGNYDINIAKTFLGIFSFKEKEYDVFFAVSKSFADFLVKAGITNVEPVTARTIPLVTPKFKVPKGYKAFKATTSAVDQRQAAGHTETILDTFGALYISSEHGELISVYPPMVVRETGGHQELLSPLLSNMRKRGRGKLGDALKEYARNLSLVIKGKNTEESIKVLASLKAHKRAVEAGGVENQLIMLWFALEAILPEKSEEAGGFSAHIKLIEPAIMIGYLYRRIYFVYMAIFNKYRTKFIDIINSATDGDRHFSKFVSIIVNDDNIIAREKITELLSDSPLLHYRFSELTENLPKKERVKFTLSTHWKNVEWQLRRIYRARNVIVHESRSYPADLESLCVHFHEYYDTIFSEISLNCDTGGVVLPGVYTYLRHIATDYLLCKDALDRAGERLTFADVRKVIPTMTLRERI